MHRPDDGSTVSPDALLLPQRRVSTRVSAMVAGGGCGLRNHVRTWHGVATVGPASVAETSRHVRGCTHRVRGMARRGCGVAAAASAACAWITLPGVRSRMPGYPTWFVRGV